MRPGEAFHRAYMQGVQSTKAAEEIEDLFEQKQARQLENKMKTDQLQKLSQLQKGNFATPEDYANTLTSLDGRPRRVNGDIIETLDGSGSVIARSPAKYGLEAMREAVINYGGITPAGVAGDLFSNEKTQAQLATALATSANKSSSAQDMMMMKMMMKGLGNNGSGGGSNSSGGDSSEIGGGKLKFRDLNETAKFAESYSTATPEVRALMENVLGIKLGGIPSTEATPSAKAPAATGKVESSLKAPANLGEIFNKSYAPAAPVEPQAGVTPPDATNIWNQLKLLLGNSSFNFSR